MKTGFRSILLAASVLAGLSGAALAGSLKIESWRNDDADIWKDKIIPAFRQSIPISRSSSHRPPPKEYNASLNARLEGGTAGDLITCRPFDASLELFNKGHLAALNDLPGMAGFSDVAKSAWTTDDGKIDLLRADGLGDPRLHLQQGDLREARV